MTTKGSPMVRCDDCDALVEESADGRSLKPHGCQPKRSNYERILAKHPRPWKVVRDPNIMDATFDGETPDPDYEGHDSFEAPYRGVVAEDMDPMTAAFIVEVVNRAAPS